MSTSSQKDADYAVISTCDDEKDDVGQATEDKKRVKCRIGTISRITLLLLAGILNVVIGALSIRYNFLELVMTERIKLRPGFPAYDTWRRPPSPIIVKTYLFAVKNPYEFLNSENGTKLQLEEIGPITYFKHVKQDDIEFKDDSTMSFTTSYDIEYPEHLNDPKLMNKSIVVVNPMLIGMAAMVHDNFVGKVAFDYVSSTESVFLNRTVYEVLWNLTCPLLEGVKKIPFFVPRSNAGVLYNALYPGSNRYNVNIGPKHGFANFFKINTLNSKSHIPVYPDNYPKECPYSLKGASEGTGFPPFLNKETTFEAFTDNLCRTYPMVYNREVRLDKFNCYEFVFRDDLYRRSNNTALDCQRMTGNVLLPDGLIDSSKCAFGTPVALSNPHFLGFKGPWEKYIDGLQPDHEKHTSRVLIEPKTGLQLDALARIQANIPLPSLKYYGNNLKPFSNMIIPNYWIEYRYQFGDKFVLTAMDIAVNYLPVLQPIVIVIALTLAAICFCKVVLRLTQSKITFVHWSKANGIEFPRICSAKFSDKEFGQVATSERDRETENGQKTLATT